MLLTRLLILSLLVTVAIAQPMPPAVQPKQAVKRSLTSTPKTASMAIATPMRVVKPAPPARTNIDIGVSPPSLSTALEASTDLKVYVYETNMVTDSIVLRLAGTKKFYRAYRQRQVVMTTVKPVMDGLHQRYYAETAPGLFTQVAEANTETNSFVMTNSPEFIRMMVTNFDSNGVESVFSDVVTATNKTQILQAK